MRLILLWIALLGAGSQLAQSAENTNTGATITRWLHYLPHLKVLLPASPATPGDEGGGHTPEDPRHLTPAEQYQAFASIMAEIKDEQVVNGSLLQRLKAFSANPWMDLAFANLLLGSPAGIVLGSIPAFNLSSWAPAAAIDLAKFLAQPCAIANQATTAHLSEEASLALSAAFSEELVFRKLLQGQVLRELPRRLLTRLGLRPELVDSLPVKVVRVLTSAYLFALAHQSPEQTAAGCLPQFFGGIAYAAAFEDTNSMATPALMHSLHNSLIVALAAALEGHVPFSFSTLMSFYYAGQHLPATYETLTRLDTVPAQALILPLEEFSDLAQTTTYLTCRYESPQGDSAKSYARNLDILAAGEPSQALPSSLLDYLLLPGRWIAGGQQFAALANPLRVRQVCANALQREHELSSEQLAGGTITLAAGNTRQRDSSPILFYFPVPREEARTLLDPVAVSSLTDELFPDPVEYFSLQEVDTYYEDWDTILIPSA